MSATLLGNRDVDWLAHMQEKRASIFMTPDYIQAMGDLFDREMQRSPDIFDLKAPLAVLSEPETALSRQARTELSELISPFLARRQRRCIGEDQDRSKHSYPKLSNHGRPSTLKLTKPQRARLDEIVALCNDLAPGGRVRDNNFHDVLARTKEKISPERYSLISKARIEGTWGAELALLSARESFTALHLKGVDKPTSFFPPRLLLLRPSETGLLLERGQLACAKTLETAYERTKSLGLEQTRMTEEDLTSALETVSGQLGRLTEWDLRPARVESLMKACAEFMSRRADVETDDRGMFGHLDIERIAAFPGQPASVGKLLFRSGRPDAAPEKVYVRSGENADAAVRTYGKLDDKSVNHRLASASLSYQFAGF